MDRLRFSVRIVVTVAMMIYVSSLNGQFLTAQNTAKTKQATFSNEKKRKLTEVLAALEQKFKVRFNYDNDYLVPMEVPDSTGITSSQDLENILKQVLPPLNLTYEKPSASFYIIVREKGKPKNRKNGADQVSTINQTQDVRLKGKVTTSKGEALAGVSIRLKGSNNATRTLADGTFSLTLPGKDGVLIISYVGYASQELPVPPSGSLQVVLEEEINSLNEVVVTGYSKEQKKDIIGSVAVVKMDNLLSIPSGNLKTQLQGNAPGVTVSSSGSPGSGGKVRIRGFGSFGGSDPLYIIDGVPASQNGVDNLNSNDIESMQVLKDASSAAIYGARAANGVIIITTKNGSPGKTKIDVSTYVGVDYVSKGDFPDVLDAQENGTLYWKAMEGAGRKVGDPDWGHPQYGYGPEPIIPQYILVVNNGARMGGAELEALKNGTPDQQALFTQLTDPASYDFATHQIVRAANTNWADEVFNPVLIQNHQVSASGGSDAGTYAIGLNYFNEGNTASKYNKYERYSIRANTLFNLGSHIRVGENMQTVYRTNKAPDTWASTVMTMHPLVPVWDDFGNPAGNAAPSTGGEPEFSSNPVTETWRNRFDGSNRLGILGNVFAEADLLEGLTLRSSFGIDYANSNSLNLTQVTYEHAQNVNPPNSLTIGQNVDNTWTWTNTLNYTRSWNKHLFKILVGSEAINTYGNSLSGTRQNLPIDNDKDFLVLSAGTGPQTNSGSFSRSSLFSLFGRADYSFMDKYFVNATLRRDQSSKFGSNYQTGYFPSAAVGWRLSSEEFMQGIQWLDDLKLRASWGVIGNQNGLGNNNQYDVYVTTDVNSYGISGDNNARAVSLTPSSLGNPNTRWEKNSTFDLGFDATLFSSAVEINFDWYNRRTTDLLAVNQAPLTGPTITQPSVNVGELMNKGIDLGFSKRGGSADFRYNASLIFSHYSNEVLRVLDNPLATLAGGNTRMGNATITRAGDPISSFYGYKIDGFFNTQEEVDTYNASNTTWLTPAVGRWRIMDINGDHKVDGNDRTVLGSPHPDFQTSLNLSFSYKNFDVSGFLFWNKGGSAFNYTRYVIDFNTFTTNRSKRMLYESWTPELGDRAKLPKLDLNDSYSSSNITDYFLEDASYLRLKSVQLGYTLPERLCKKIRMEKLRFYVQGQNLWTVTNSTLMDPGYAQASGGDTSMGVVNNYVPVPRQFIVGVSVGL